MSTLSATYRSRQKVLGYPVDTVDESLALEIIEECWRTGKRLHIVTLNAEMVIAAQKDQQLDRIIRHAHLIIPDGSGVVWALKLVGYTVNKLPGIELASASLGLAARTGAKVALIGGKSEILKQNEQVLTNLHPGLQIAAVQDGYFSVEEEEAIIERLARTEPQLVLVALGVPKQEYFIDKWQAAFPKAVMIGVGGSFDVWAGAVKRAPAVFRKAHLEWFYRLMKEPWRFNRMASALPSFAVQVIEEQIKLRMDNRKSHGEGEKRGIARQPKSHDKSKERSKDK